MPRTLSAIDAIANETSFEPELMGPLMGAVAASENGRAVHGEGATLKSATPGRLGFTQLPATRPA